MLDWIIWNSPVIFAIVAPIGLLVMAYRVSQRTRPVQYSVRKRGYGR